MERVSFQVKKNNKSTTTVKLSDVLFVPGFGKNLISVKRIADGHSATFEEEQRNYLD